jgi:hypothetical protein
VVLKHVAAVSRLTLNPERRSPAGATLDTDEQHPCRSIQAVPACAVTIESDNGLNAVPQRDLATALQAHVEKHFHDSSAHPDALKQDYDGIHRLRGAAVPVGSKAPDVHPNHLRDMLAFVASLYPYLVTHLLA